MSNLLNYYLNSFRSYLAAMEQCSAQATAAGEDPGPGRQTTECVRVALMVGE